MLQCADFKVQICIKPRKIALGRDATTYLAGSHTPCQLGGGVSVFWTMTLVADFLAGSTKGTPAFINQVWGPTSCMEARKLKKKKTEIFKQQEDFRQQSQNQSYSDVSIKPLTVNRQQTVFFYSYYA